jgi:hypothetical protein
VLQVTKSRRRHGVVDLEDCRIGFISRVDYPSVGFRAGLLELARQRFVEDDVHFVVLAGGLISGRHVLETIRSMKRRIAETNARLKLLVKRDGSPIDPDDRVMVDSITALRTQIEQYQERIDELDPERLARELAAKLPVFRNARGDVVRLYIYTSEPYDGDVGAEVARRLTDPDLDRDDIRVYDDPRMSIKQGGRYIEVLVPHKGTFMRANYDSTHVQRVIMDRRRARTSELPDLIVVGCIGVTITKPQGEYPVPFISLPVLHRLPEGGGLAEHEIGVRVVTMKAGVVDPVFSNYSYGDRVHTETRALRLPPGLTPSERQVAQAFLRNGGHMAQGLVADETGLSRAEVSAALSRLAVPPGDRRRIWPGLRYSPEAALWGLDSWWLRDHLRYPRVPATATDSVVVVGCPHMGSIYTDVNYMLRDVPRAVIEQDAHTLVFAGDEVEGINHDLMIIGEVAAGLNVTQQEVLAGKAIAKIVMDVFRIRFSEAISSGQIDALAIRRALDYALLDVEMIPGNHDAWAAKSGHTPLVTIKHEAVEQIFLQVNAILTEMGVWIPDLYGLVQAKINEPEDGIFALPSGLMVQIMHPWMGRTKTVSIRLEEALEYARQCQVVLVANFHVGIHLETWDPVLGPRVGLQIGTIKRKTGFEANHMKIVDHGFGALVIRSARGRIINSRSTFYAAPATSTSVLCRDWSVTQLARRWGLAD